VELAVDTNVIVRYVTRDDPLQERRARLLFTSHRIFVPKTVLLETEWVLRFAYGYEPPQIEQVLIMLMESEGVRLEDEAVVHRALEGLREGLDFADAMHLASCDGIEQFASFDKPLLKRASRVFAKPDVISP
jgi:predicted nucleic-acid-binding protein